MERKNILLRYGKIRIFALIILIIGAAYYGLKHSYRAYPLYEGETMGTYYRIKINSPRVPLYIHDLIEKELKQVNKAMSVFDKTSEISRINQAPAGKKIELSPAMSELMQTAEKVYKQSHGAFDPSLGKLIKVWGFGPQNPTEQPQKADIEKLMQTVGFAKIEFSPDYKQMHKKVEGLELNLSAIAKGYGVDRVYRLLKEKGYHDFIVDIGGEVRTSGNRNAEEAGWNVGISSPDNSGRTVYVMNLQDKAIATSGDYRNYKEENGKRYAHTISSQDGYPVENNVASVTIISDNCMEADAYATAIMALGAQQGMALAEQQNMAVLIFEHIPNSQGEYKLWHSEEFKKMVKGPLYEQYQ